MTLSIVSPTRRPELRFGVTIEIVRAMRVALQFLLGKQVGPSNEECNFPPCGVMDEWIERQRDVDAAGERLAQQHAAAACHLKTAINGRSTAQLQRAPRFDRS